VYRDLPGTASARRFGGGFLGVSPVLDSLYERRWVCFVEKGCRDRGDHDRLAPGPGSAEERHAVGLLSAPIGCVVSRFLCGVSVIGGFVSSILGCRFRADVLRLFGLFRRPSMGPFSRARLMQGPFTPTWEPTKSVTFCDITTGRHDRQRRNNLQNQLDLHRRSSTRLTPHSG
jgi:hypothetical protein